MTDRDATGRFIKGSTGNPTGRAPKEREQRYYQVTVSAVSFNDWERIVQKARDQALKGDPVARKWLSDYLIGPPVQRNEHTGEGGGPVTLRVVRDMESGSRIPDPSTKPAP